MSFCCPRCHKSVEADGTSPLLACPECGGGLDTLATEPDSAESLDDGEIPERIGRYEIGEPIGSGATGEVYRGHDVGLQRDVAVKLPRRHLIASRQTANAFLAEARTLASLDHPNILPIYDLGRTDTGLCFLVCKLFEGHSLKYRLARARPTIAESAELVRGLAEALHYAHRQGLVHRDVKPDNILVDAEGRPVLADFDLALHPRDFGKGPTFVGTISYMSPEQARREGHRVDARTDVYSLGVVFYEMLTGRRPFESDQIEDLLEQIKSHDPLPPRHIEPAVPSELERICLRAIAKLPSQRYATAQDLADDVRLFQMGTARGPAAEPLAHVSATVIPRGLRAFSARDADFFLELLPGPRDRAGLPDVLRFWKDRLDSTDPESAFRVGLMLGPTGSGKSSLLQAGVVPRLASHVHVHRIEATPDETERRLAAGLRKCCPALPSDGSLAELLGRLRLGEGLPPGKQKIVVLLDQFEQWLQGRRDFAETPLVAALRQCDGVHVQAVLLVRDDFSLAASRFLHEVEVPIIEGGNFATVDRFTPAHARKVLTSFGQAYGTLPTPPAPRTREQELFLDHAVEGLTEDGLVIPVRLVLLAEALKTRPWTSASLQEVGGATGSAVVFLEESLGDHAVNPAHRRFHAAACAMLQALLPARGEKLKGVKRSVPELMDISGLADLPDDFDALLQLLSGELRLITPVEQEDGGSVNALDQRAGYYQLTHDYLVSALRLWLTQQQRTTRRGRAQLRLAEFADDWNALPEKRRLPGAWTWASIGLLSRHQDWTGAQRRMMRAATRHHLMRGGIVLAGFLVLVLGWRQYSRREAAEFAAQHAADQVAQLRSAPIRNVAGIIEALARDWPESEPLLRAALQETDLDPMQQRNLQLALLRVDPRQAEPLLQRMLSARPEELLFLRQNLLPYRAQLDEGLWRIVEGPRQNAERRLRAAGALAGFDAESPRWPTVVENVATDLLRQNPLELPFWLEVFRPIRVSLLQPLGRFFRNSTDTSHRRLAAVILADYAVDQPTVLRELLLAATPDQFPLIWQPFEKCGTQEIPRLNAELDRLAAPDATDENTSESARRQAQAAVILVQLGQEERVWPLLRLQPDRSVRSYLVHLLAALRTDPRLLERRWRQENDAGARQALILSLGESDPAGLDPDQRRTLVAEWLHLYRTDPDPGIHGAIDWTLRQRWQHEAEIHALDQSLAGKTPGERRWFVNGQGQTFLVVPGPVDLPPSPAGKPGPRIPRSFAVALKDVTVAQYDRFQQAHPAYRYPDFPAQYLEGGESPMIWLNWYDAAAYCRWLSEQEGVPETEMCYPPLAQIKTGMKLPANYLSRTGYRLPTAAEWRYAARAGTTTPRFFGKGEALVAQFGWYANIAAAHVHPVGSLKPNGLGLFDVYGNVWQWNQDRAFRPDAAVDREDQAAIEEKDPRLILGGSFADQSFALTSNSFVPRRPIECHAQYGMRLARTIR